MSTLQIQKRMSLYLGNTANSRSQPPIGQKDKFGQTALHQAALWGSLKGTQWLTGHCIDPQAVNKYNKTAKDDAKSRSKTKVMNFLEKIEAVPPELFTVKHPSSLNHSLK